MYSILKFFALFVVLINYSFSQTLPSFIELVKDNGNKVVNISASKSVDNSGPNIPEDDPFYDFFRRFGPPQGPKEYESRARGSGFIISNDGYILTNAHVVGDSDDVTVKLNDKREFSAKVIGSDIRTDVAIIKIETNNLPAVAIGDPSKLEVGEWVLAIGSPFGFENTVTAGIVSAKGRSLPQENYVPFIQTDVAINPGNSGGPLFNLKGEVVGINSQIYSRTGGFMGLSFAIPIDVAMDIANQLKETGVVKRGRIGVVIQEITNELAESFGLRKAVGALVNSVEPGGPADLAGIETSDIILRFGNKLIENVGDLPKVVASTKPGDVVEIEVWRKGKPKILKITVGSLLENNTKKAEKPKNEQQSSNKVEILGIFVSNLDPENTSGGILITKVESPAMESGVKSGDILLAINNIQIKDVNDLMKILDDFADSRSVALLIKRKSGSVYIPIRIKR